MENGTHNGMRTNHDRSPWMNGANGTLVKGNMSPDKGKALADNAAMANGGDDSYMDMDSHNGRLEATPNASRMNDLPDEIQHITTEILPLGLLLTRLAQFTHGRLQEEIAVLASKPVPYLTTNGNAGYNFTGTEDTSPESLDKKTSLLNFIQDIHQRWVKALVISEWSKKAGQVGRLIDIRAHLVGQLEWFEHTFRCLLDVKEATKWAKLPSPDLRTALEVLTTREVSWMPDFGYVDLSPISVEERASWVEEINTLLSVRLSYYEHDKIPIAFREYAINSGRVTFRVEGEFEVDLTIGDEDFDKQFWFIDFRYLFRPAVTELTSQVRAYLERKVNDALAADGLAGCYKYLHEFVLTQKIGEFRRQAVRLSKERWIDTLKVERLNRAMAIQYWLNKPHSRLFKSWIILGVHSGVGPDGIQDPKSPSRLHLRWFRDNVEVKDFDIPFNTQTIFTESLLTTVIARHVEYLLGSICQKLLTKPRFSQREARLDLQLSRNEPLDSSLTVQLFDEEDAKLGLDPITGAFTMFPKSSVIMDGERKFNLSHTPAEDGPLILEKLRCAYTIKDLHNRAHSIGWTFSQSPISSDDIKTIVFSDDTPSREKNYQTVWMRKDGWNPQWFIIMCMSLGGDHWWLVELSGQRPGLPNGRLKMFTKMPMTSAQLSLSDSFFQNLALYVTGMVSHITDLRELHSKRMTHATRELANSSFSQVKLPTIFVRLSEMLNPNNPDGQPAPEASTVPWAREFIPITFRGIKGHSEDQATLAMLPDIGSPNGAKRVPRTRIIAEARLAVTNKAKFRLLKANVDHDVIFNPHLGQFALRLRGEMGTPVVHLLAARIRALERLVELVEAISKAGKNAVPESATLREVVFSYNSPPPPGLSSHSPENRTWRARLDLTQSKGVALTLENGNPQLRILDVLIKIAGSSKFHQLPSWLIMTLPLYRGLGKIEDEWEKFALRNEGQFQVFNRTIDWLVIRFTLPTTPSSPPRPPRTLLLDVKAKLRKTKMLWHIERPAITGVASGAKVPNDEFDRVLQQGVWTATSIEGVKTFGTGAAADPETGIESLLLLISNAVRSLLGAQLPPPHPVSQGMQGPQQGPQQAGHEPQPQVHGMPQQPQQQLHQPPGPPANSRFHMQQQHQQHHPMPQMTPVPHPTQLQRQQHHQQQAMMAQQQQQQQQHHHQQQQQINGGQGQGHRGVMGNTKNAPLVVLD
ncbi:mediator complex subunit MED14-domain-containing protein [Bombardia bombarda]|uniref:Mediator of RNA polymerase II transcription subunit 14 n=1 Tax=Bombardia bombarda TaxID=252184 RepID=A0AA40BY82_9PEZI|nr:mediator complex subunit MED14-domain-containing protein [Bombardia bombarda]